MQFFHFGTGNQLIQQINSGYCMQYSDSVEQVFVAHDSITQSNYSDYSAILSCTPNGATTALADFALTWGSIEIAGTTYWGFYCYLSSLYTQVNGPMACNLVVSNLTQVIVSQTFSIMVNASSSSTNWSESINQAQWKELMNYVSGLKIPNLGTVNFVLGTAGSIIDNYYGSENAGAYYFTDSSGNSYLLAVGYSRTVTTQTLYYKLAGNSVFVGAQRTYDSGATTPEWSAWSQYTGYLPLAGGTLTGDIYFADGQSIYFKDKNGNVISTANKNGFAVADEQGTHETVYGFGKINSRGVDFTFPTTAGTLATYEWAKAITDNIQTEIDNINAITDYIQTEIDSINSTSAYSEEQRAKAAEQALQASIDTVNATQNVVDIVGTKALLDSYDTANLHTNDKIEVLSDETKSGANSIYSWNGISWDFIGQKDPYYNKSEADAKFAKKAVDYVVSIPAASWVAEPSTDYPDMVVYLVSTAAVPCTSKTDLIYDAVDDLTAGTFGSDAVANFGIRAKTTDLGLKFYAKYGKPDVDVSFDVCVIKEAE
jgi:hypothetical protein